jgi:cobalt/nickel transport system ATP-binding protein
MTLTLAMDPSLSQTVAAITVESLYFSYPQGGEILSGLTFVVQSEEKVGVIGPNGAGKTTCFLAICGLLKPTSGHIYVFGDPVIPGRIRSEVGLVFQNPNDQLFSNSVWEDVAFGPENIGLLPEVIQERVQEALRLTGTEHLAERAPHHLSGGQKRMVAIAGVLAMQPQIMIYDEPSANLDIRSRRRLIQFLQESKQTLLIASHDLEFILEVCNKVILIDNGNVVAQGSCQEVMGNEDLMQSHALEKPYSLSHSHGSNP